MKNKNWPTPSAAWDFCKKRIPKINTCRGPSATNPPRAPSSDEEVHSDDEIFREIEDYAIEAEGEDHVQVWDPPLYVLTPDVRWYEGASSFGGAGPTTSGAPPADFDS